MADQSFQNGQTLEWFFEPLYIARIVSLSQEESDRRVRAYQNAAHPLESTDPPTKPAWGAELELSHFQLANLVAWHNVANKYGNPSMVQLTREMVQLIVAQLMAQLGYYSCHNTILDTCQCLCLMLLNMCLAQKLKQVYQCYKNKDGAIITMCDIVPNIYPLISQFRSEKTSCPSLMACISSFAYCKIKKAVFISTPRHSCRSFQPNRSKVS